MDVYDCSRRMFYYCDMIRTEFPARVIGQSFVRLRLHVAFGSGVERRSVTARTVRSADPHEFACWDDNWRESENMGMPTPSPETVKKKKAKKAVKKSAKKRGQRALLQDRLAEYEKKERDWGSREGALEARLLDQAGQLLSTEGNLAATAGNLAAAEKTLKSTQEQISNSIKNHAMDLYSRARERHGELPLWTVLDEGDQTEWGKLALDVEAMKAKRQALMHTIFLKYGSDAARFALDAAKADPASFPSGARRGRGPYIDT